MDRTPRPLELLIVSSSPIYARALEQMLEDEPVCWRTRLLADPEIEDPAAATFEDVVLVVPQDWEELAYWIPPLRRQYGTRPWLILAELPMVGMFLSLIEDQPCVVVDPGASTSLLRSALQAAARRRCLNLPTELRAMFVRNAGCKPSGEQYPLPSAIELQCACAVSLGLSNRQIAQALSVTEGTVKSHVHRLLQKLELPERKALGAFIRRVLPSLPYLW